MAEADNIQIKGKLKICIKYGPTNCYDIVVE